MEHIYSAQNPNLKQARKLMKSARERQRSGRILLDGVHLIQAYQGRFGLSQAVVLLDEAASGRAELNELVATFGDQTKTFSVAPHLFAGISPVDTPSGIVAMCDRPHLDRPQSGAEFKLLLDGIQDPGNIGSILRTAAATGVDEVLLTSTCADPWSPRCLRGGMGAQFVLPVATGVDLTRVMDEFEGNTVATSSHAGQALMDVGLSRPLLVVFGAEGAGLRREVLVRASLTVRIPLQRHIESLNVAAAAAMVCYEQVRQATRADA